MFETLLHKSISIFYDDLGYEFKRIFGNSSFLDQLKNVTTLNEAAPGLQIRVRIGNLFSLFLIQTYAVGTQKNYLNQTVLLSTQNICLK